MHLIRCTDETYGGSKIGSAMCTNISLPSSGAYSSDRSLTSVHRPTARPVRCQVGSMQSKIGQIVFQKSSGPSCANFAS